MSTFVTATELADLDPAKRVNYTLGMIIGADDLRQDQRYLTARDERHQRSLHGWGVVSGLAVDVDPQLRLRVHPGQAVDGEGRSICVDRTQCADLLAWLNARAGEVDVAAPVEVWVLLCYDTCETDLLPVPSGPCQSLEDSLAPSRIVDSFRLELSLADPGRRQDRAHPTFVEVMTGLVDTDDVDEKREALERFVEERGVEPAYAGPCLDAAGDPCVPIGRVALDLGLDGETIVFGTDPTDDDVDVGGRPIMLSSTFLQEWLLRVEGGGVITMEPDLSILELNDTATPGTPPDTTPDVGDVADGSVLHFEQSSGLWLTRQLRLGLLADVDLEAEPIGEGVYLGWDDAGNVWRPRTVTHPEVDVPDIDRDFVRSREESMIAIVAAGVVELETEGLQESPFEVDNVEGRVRTEYGGLRYDFGIGSARHGLFRVTFPGLAEAIERYGRLLGRDFVVKATIEHGTSMATIQVVHVGRDGIVLRYGVHGVEDERDGLVKELLASEFRVEIDRSSVTVHLEISVFDDAEIGGAGPIRSTDHRNDVGELWEPQP